ncbi:hypothetical protein BE18_20040 [Sorangium cellulosum]|uniref:Uncharacterized protein n=1 Tax=Sorangium cellulosum TaxID=56 RepID=A0A150RMY6_SORCE|nr:hypothetical protein BE18_20040 [Sorangium cellulosum]
MRRVEPVRGAESQLFFPLDVLGLAVEEDDRVGARARIDEEGDPLLRKEPPDEIVIRLAVLRRHLARRVAVHEPPALRGGGDARAREDLLHDVGSRHALEDAAVGALGEAEQPGARDEPRPGLLRAPRGPALGLDDDAGQPALLAAAAARQGEHERLADEGRRVRPARELAPERADVVDRLARLEPEEGKRSAVDRELVSDLDEVCHA